MSNEINNVSAEQEVIETPADINPTTVENNEPINEPAAEPPKAEIVSTPEVSQESSEKTKENNERKEHLEAVFNELKGVKENDSTIEIEITSRIKGGLRAVYNDFQLFLPASHFTIKRTPTEEELQESIGTKFNVKIHEIQELEDGRKAVIVTRKAMLVEDFWKNIEVGQIVSGKITSIASFGVFIDLGGIEGLIHISRLSQVHVDDPAKLYKKGDTLEAKIVNIDKEKNKIALSRKELEASPWDTVDTDFIVDSTIKGIVRRLTDFGAYIELKPGVDGLLRTPELSWTRRIKHPGEVIKVNEEIDVVVLSINKDKHTLALSLKKTLPNPWAELAAKYPIGTEVMGTVAQVMPQGVIISIANEVDGFMPKSKIKSIGKGKKIPFEAGEEIEVKIADIVPEQESLILEPAKEESPAVAAKKPFTAENPKDKGAGSISFMDMLSENQKNELFNTVK